MAASSVLCFICQKDTLVPKVVFIRNHGPFDVFECSSMPPCWTNKKQVFCAFCNKMVLFCELDVCQACLQHKHMCARQPLATISCILCHHETCYYRCSRDATYIGYPGRRVCNWCVKSQQIEPKCHATTKDGKRCRKMVKNDNLFCHIHRYHKRTDC